MEKTLTNEQFVAALRQIADHYEAHPETALPYPRLHIFADTKGEFIAAARELARGGRVTKEGDPIESIYPQYRATRDFGGVQVQARIDRKLFCRLVTPAVYDCPDSLLEEGAEYKEVA